MHAHVRTHAHTHTHTCGNSGQMSSSTQWEGIELLWSSSCAFYIQVGGWVCVLRHCNLLTVAACADLANCVLFAILHDWPGLAGITLRQITSFPVISAFFPPFIIVQFDYIQQICQRGWNETEAEDWHVWGGIFKDRKSRTCLRDTSGQPMQVLLQLVFALSLVILVNMLPQRGLLPSCAHRSTFNAIHCDQFL